jgi:hypothetical protein
MRSKFSRIISISFTITLVTMVSRAGPITFQPGDIIAVLATDSTRYLILQVTSSLL